MTDDLPYVDEHHATIAAPREVVWTALRHYVDTSLGTTASSPLARILGTVPPTGFEVSREIPGLRVSLSGRHRFSRYRLVFELADISNSDAPNGEVSKGEVSKGEVSNGGTRLSAYTYAVFPGLTGRVYRALVIGTRAHAVAVQGMLRSVRRSSLS